MKYKFLVIVLFFSKYCYSSNNDTINHSYFNILKIVLSQDESIKTIKFEEKHYWNGKLKSQYMYVSLNNDSVERFWSVGKGFWFHKNGKLKGFLSHDIKTKQLIYTSFLYNKDSQIIGMIIYDYTNGSFLSTSFNKKYCSFVPCTSIETRFRNSKKYYECIRNFCNHSFKDIYYNDDGTIKNNK